MSPIENSSRLLRWTRAAAFLGRNAVTLLGAIITTSTAFTLVVFWMSSAFRPSQNPYQGLLGFFLLPGVFAFGLALMPIGLWFRRHKLKKAGELPDPYPEVDLPAGFLKRAVFAFGGLTLVNVVILGYATYSGVHYMDSQAFCGKTCHTVMAPEYNAYQSSAHSRVSCVQCHIGPGASWAVKAKISGTRQLFAVGLGTYSRPILSPVRELRPARDTCEQCHWPEKFHDQRIVVKKKYADDEASTPLTTILALKVGGRTAAGPTGIHGRHLQETTYVTKDHSRQEIGTVTYRDGKELVTYEVAGAKEPMKGEVRTMDCVDCHNRPSHIFEQPEQAVDRAITEGRISRELPFIRKTSVAALKAELGGPGTAERLNATLTKFYQEGYAEVFRKSRNLVEAAAVELAAIHARNVYPEMKLTWGTYRSNLGHEETPGCFRCHDGNHTSASGKTITPECDACHTIMAQDEENPKILADLGM